MVYIHHVAKFTKFYLFNFMSYIKKFNAKIIFTVMTRHPKNVGPSRDVNKEIKQALCRIVRIWYVTNVQLHSLRPPLGNCPNICIPTTYLFRKYCSPEKNLALKPLPEIMQVLHWGNTVGNLVMFSNKNPFADPSYCQYFVDLQLRILLTKSKLQEKELENYQNSCRVCCPPSPPP